MARTALIQPETPPGIVMNVAEAPDDFHLDGFLCVASDVAKIGDTWDGNVFTSPPEPNPTQDELYNYATQKQAILMSGGVTVNVGGDTPVVVSAATDTNSRTNLIGLYMLAQLNPAMTTSWVVGNEFTSLTAAQVMTLAAAVGLFVQQTYNALADVQTAISLGNIITIDGINNANWPSTIIS